MEAQREVWSILGRPTQITAEFTRQPISDTVYWSWYPNAIVPHWHETGTVTSTMTITNTLGPKITMIRVEGEATLLDGEAPKCWEPCAPQGRFDVKIYTLEILLPLIKR